MTLPQTINSNSTKEEIIDALTDLFVPYAKELLNSGGDFSYMNMYADNFLSPLTSQTSLTDFEVYELLNEACELSWQKAINA